MKTLKFCIPLFVLLFLVNVPLKAQKIILSPNVTGISVSYTPPTYEGRPVQITVNSGFLPRNLAVAMYTTSPESFEQIALESSGSLTTNHTFTLYGPLASTVEVRCGYIDNQGTYRESDGGCIIVIEPLSTDGLGPKP